MHISPFSFEIIDWKNIVPEIHEGESGTAAWQVLRIGEVRVRRLEYSAGYKADHWCTKGHIIYCVSGEMHTELEDGRILKLDEGKTYIVGDNCEAHRSFTENGCVLFVVD